MLPGALEEGEVEETYNRKTNKVKTRGREGTKGSDQEIQLTLTQDNV